MQKLPRILIALSLGAAAAVTAQTTNTTPENRDGSPRGRHGHGPGGFRGGHPIVRALDTDNNRELSASELTGAPAALRALDVNKDGSVTKDEIHSALAGARTRPEGAPERPAGTRERPADAPERPADQLRKMHSRLMDPVMLALDANSDGALSETEMTNATASLNALDANKDGKLTLDELRPLPPTE
jgi:hypothetical protein